MAKKGTTHYLAKDTRDYLALQKARTEGGQSAVINDALRLHAFLSDQRAFSVEFPGLTDATADILSAGLKHRFKNPLDG